jgi:hypothetical protein
MKMKTSNKSKSLFLALFLIFFVNYFVKSFLPTLFFISLYFSEFLAAILFIPFIMAALLFFKTLFNKNSKNKKIRKIELGYNVMSILLLLTVIPGLNTHLDFWIHYPVRSTITNDLIEEPVENRTDINTYISPISDGGVINVLGDGNGNGDWKLDSNNRNLEVLFYTHKGGRDNYSAFLYKETNDPPKSSSTCTKLIDWKEMKDNWYWIRCS